MHRRPKSRDMLAFTRRARRKAGASWPAALDRHTFSLSQVCFSEPPAPPSHNITAVAGTAVAVAVAGTAAVAAGTAADGMAVAGMAEAGTLVLASAGMAVGAAITAADAATAGSTMAPITRGSRPTIMDSRGPAQRFTERHTLRWSRLLQFTSIRRPRRPPRCSIALTVRRSTLALPALLRHLRSLQRQLRRLYRLHASAQSAAEA